MKPILSSNILFIRCWELFARNLHRYQVFFSPSKKPWIWIRSEVFPLGCIPTPTESLSHFSISPLSCPGLASDCVQSEMEVSWSSQSSRRFDWEIQIEFIFYMFPVNLDKCQREEINRHQRPQTKSISSEDKIKQTRINWISYEIFHNSALISAISLSRVELSYQFWLVRNNFPF